MLMLMVPENNTDADQNINANIDGVVPPVSHPGVVPVGIGEQPQSVVPQVTPDTGTLIQPNVSNTVASPTVLSPEPVTPAPPPEVSNITATTPPPAPTPLAASPDTPQKKKSSWLKKLVLIFGLVLLFTGAITGAYIFGRQHERIVIKTPTLKPINLPPQAVVVANCTEGRGKQYILPKDIPLGPIYDVVNSKVIAVEYNLNINDIQSNPDSLSNTILKLARDYPVDHFSIVPVTPKAGESIANIHLIMFVVSKTEANAITCTIPKT